MKRKLSLLAMLASLLAAGCGLLERGEGSVTGSGVMAQETRAVSGFSAVALQGLGDVIITQGAAEALTVEAEDNILPLLTSSVEAGTLRLGVNRATWRTSIMPTQPIRFHVTVLNLETFELSGAGDVEAASLSVDDLTLRLSGAGDVRLGDLRAESLTVQLDGAGSVTLAGEAARQTVRITGAGDYNAGDLESQSAEIVLSGLGSATLWVRANLDVRITGAGSVSYYGQPSVDRREISGLGDINPMGEK